MMRNRLSCAVLLAIPLAAACSDKDPGNDQSLGTAPTSAVRLDLETSEQILLGLEEPTNIVARVTYADGSPAKDRPVSFTVSGDTGNASLQQQVLTGADGRVTNQLNSGNTRAEFDLTLTTMQAEGEGLNPTISIHVTIDGVYRGKLQVKYTYNVPITIVQIDTRIHRGSLNCAQITWPTQPSGQEQKQMVPVVQGMAANAAATFDGLNEDVIYTVTASATGIAGQQVAVGCAVAPAIQGRTTVNATVALNLRPVALTGNYDFGTEIKVTQALPGKVGAIIDEIERWLIDPANTASEYIIKGLQQVLSQLGIPEAASEYVLKGFIQGLWVAHLYPNGAADPALPGDADKDGDFDPENGNAIDDVIEQVLLDKAPDWVQNGLLAGGDIVGLFTHLTMGGQLKIGSVSEAGDFSGRWEWNKFLFQWRWGQDCDPDNTCCGRQVFTDAELQPVAADISGTVKPTTDPLAFAIEIPEQRVNIRYGDLALFLVEELLLPALTGQHTLGCAIESLFGCSEGGDKTFECTQNGEQSTADDAADGDICGCERLGVWLNSKVSAISVQMGTDGCRMGLNAGLGLLEQKLEDLQYGGTDAYYLTLAATGMLSDADRDLHVDVVDAASSGKLYIDSKPAACGGDFDADLQRTGCVVDSACKDYESCTVRFDPLDDCAGRKVCVQRVGERLGGQPCSQNNQCWSNVCLNTGKCMELCGLDTDCTGGLTCSDNAYPVTVAEGAVIDINSCQ